MEFMGKKLEDIIVTLPYEDGTSLECGVYSYFEVNNKKYFALLPLKGEKELDFSHSYMLYEVEEDEENNPIVLYISLWRMYYGFYGEKVRGYYRDTSI